MPKKPASLDELIAKKAEEFADQVRAAAAIADKEEEIRIEVERQLAFLEKQAGVKLKGKHEFTVASGRVDSVYNCVIIEYKNPSSPGARIGPAANSPGAKKVVEQIKSRFYDMRSKDTLNTLFGVGCDGNHFIFVRFYEDKWQVQDPVEVNKHSAERFLWALFNLGESGRRFDPEHLAGDFGSSEGSVATAGIPVFYEAISAATNPKAQTFFNQWKILFGEVCGYDVDNPSDKIKKLADFYGVPSKGVKPAEMLFAVHTYYALFMKLLAGEIIAHFHRLPSQIGKIVAAPTPPKLKEALTDLEAGGIFRHLGITNFLEGDLFAWYLPAWSDKIETVIRKMAAKLDAYNPGTLAEEPAESRDMLKKLYQQLFPKSVRHDLGEYYTPDWLAEHVLNELGYVGDPDKRLLDPACGSGTFLVMAITRIRAWYEKNREKLRYDEGELCKKILANIIGFDLNPLAVMAARTNYLIAIRDLVSHVDKVEIPVYLCDSILTPAEYGDLFAASTGAAKVPCAACKPPHLLVPSEIATNAQDVAKYAEQLEFCVRNAYEPKEFIQRCRDDGLAITSKSLHADLYAELVKLDKANKNGVWARIIKNSFAPLFVGGVDYVVGNPPWVNWESLPADYRDSTKPLWNRYGLFTLSGHAARLGGGKKDLSMLFVYESVESYLNEGGILGFVITQSLFKTREAGAGFRRFSFNSNDKLKYIQPKRVIDMTELHPFEGATNRTASFVCSVSETATKWPIDYRVWKPKPGAEINEASELGEVMKSTKVSRIAAEPMHKDEPSSAWLTAPASTLAALEKVKGRTEVKAHAGVCTWMNGIFWLKNVERISSAKVRIQNWHDVGKKKVEAVDTIIESDLVYPLLRGRDVHKWRSNPSTHILLTQDPETRTGVAQARMKRDLGKTYEYLRRFEALLRKRPGYVKYFDPDKDPFWTIYNVGTYSVAPHRVLFKELTDFFQCAVPEAGDHPAIADTKLRFIECTSLEEAHFRCGVLNSAPAVLYLYATATWVQTADYQASDIGRLAIPSFNRKNELHKSIGALSIKCHKHAMRDEGDIVHSLEATLDDAVASMWKLTNSELEAVHDALREFGYFEAHDDPDEDED